MAILTPNAPNLAFQVPDLQKGVDNLSGGLQALAFGLDKYKLNKERNRFNTAIEEGYKAPGLAGNPQLQPQAESSGGEQPQVPGLAGALAAHKAMELAAIRAKTHGVDTGGYEAMRNRQAQEEAEQMALADKNTMGAFKEFKDMADGNKILRGQYNSANDKYLEYVKENQQKIESNPTIKAEAERLLAAANEAKYKMEVNEQRANEMANYVESLGQNRYGFINQAVKNWNNRKDLEKGEMVNPYATELNRTPDQIKIDDYATSYKGMNIITENEAMEWLRQNGLPERTDYANRVLKGVNDQAKANFNNAMNGGDAKLKNLAIKNSQENLEQNLLGGQVKIETIRADRDNALNSILSMKKLTSPKERGIWLKEESDKIGKQFGINLGWLAEFAGFDTMNQEQKNFINTKWSEVLSRLEIEALKNNNVLNKHEKK